MKTPRVKRGETTLGKRRGFYLIPSLFTVANIFCGFLSIVASSRGQFERASILILIAIFADVLDGRIARTVIENDAPSHQSCDLFERDSPRRSVPH